MFRIKICGITHPDQGVAIAQLGATALGFICVSKSPRFVTPEQIRAVVEALPRSAQGMPDVDRIGVFVNASVADIVQTVAIAGLNGVQLHGDESPAFCRQLRAALEAASKPFASGPLRIWIACKRMIIPMRFRSPRSLRSVRITILTSGLVTVLMRCCWMLIILICSAARGAHWTGKR